MQSVPLETDLVHFRIGDLPACRVLGRVNLGVNFQSLLGRCSRNEVDDHLEAGEWLAPPILADEGEKTVLDLVPLARAGRKVAHSNRQSGFVGESLQLAFP